MHKVYTCADCDKIFDKIWDVKVHSYNHSYTNTDKKKTWGKNLKKIDQEFLLWKVV